MLQPTNERLSGFASRAEFDRKNRFFQEDDAIEVLV